MTSMNDLHIDEAIKQPKRYWNVDGIPETVMGISWLVLSAALLVVELMPKDRSFRYPAGALIVAMIAMGVLMPFWLPRTIRRWKERVTYPRTGYVEPRKPSVAVRISAIFLTGLTAFGIVLGARSGSSVREWMPIAVAMLVSGALVHLAWRMRTARLAILAPLIAVSALITTAIHLHVGVSYGVIWLTSAVVCLVDGLLTLRGYLKAHPAPAGEQL